MIRRILREEINKVVKNLYRKEIGFAVSNSGLYADYSSNVAMVLGEGNFQGVAEKIKEELLSREEIKKYVSKIEVTESGFLNFWICDKSLEEGIKFSLKDKFEFGKEKIQVEFISANPTGELHIGHGRGGFCGDVLSNILDMAGNKVDKEFYINDAKESTQIKELGKMVLGKGESYKTKNIESKIKNLESELKELSDDGEAGYLIAQEIQKDNKIFIEEDLMIKIDNWFSEEEKIYKNKLIDKTLDLLKKKDLIYEKEGAIWIKTSEHGDDEDRVVVRSDNVPSYFLADIAYHIYKFEKKKYDLVIDIWGADHQGHVKRMHAMKEALGLEGELRLLISQMVTLKEGGKKKKLSKRKGDVVLLKDLLKEVGLDALRWFFLQKSLSTHMEFDMNLAKEQSKKNPVYYVQYAGARMCSILKKSEITNFKSQINLEILNSKEERNLILKLIQFSEVVEDISKDYQAHHLITYAHDLARTFTGFYENVPVLNIESLKPETTEKLKSARLGLVYATRKILERTLSLMGISAPEKM